MPMRSGNGTWSSAQEVGAEVGVDALDVTIADSFGWQSILDLAQGARGSDPFGIRAEFVQLVRAAETAKSVNE